MLFPQFILRHPQVGQQIADFELLDLKVAVAVYELEDGSEWCCPYKT
jgi:hypothetical protein